MSGVGELLAAQVRDEVRRRALDPAIEPVSVRKLAADAVADYADRRLTAALPPLGDADAVAREVYDAVAGFGVLQPFLDDPTVEEIWINEPDRVFAARRGGSELTTAVLTDGDVRELVERMLRSSGRRVDLSSPFVDATLPDGSRLHVVIPDVTRRHWAVNVRKFVLAAASLDDLAVIATLTPAAADFLRAAVVAGLNILVSGGTQTGKTTTLNGLAASIPPRERVITCEEVFELALGLPDVVALQTRQPNLEGAGEIPLRRLVKEALRMRPDRLLVGEVRQEECLDLLIALNSGVPGMCTIHANSARDAVTKMCTLPLLAGPNVTHDFVVPTVGASVDLVVQMVRDRDGRRRVREILALPGRVEGGVVEVAELFVTRAGRLARAAGWPPRRERFEAAGIDLRDVLAAPSLERD